MRILYIAPLVLSGEHFESGVIGYGQTMGGALVRELRRLGHTVDVVPENGSATSTAELATQTYDELTRHDLRQFDALFMFNIFHQFAAEVRRLLYASGATETRLAGYTHGSHWDPSDTWRDRYPMLRYADLGNLLALDDVLMVSHQMSEVMVRTIGDALGSATADILADRARVVGSTIDIERIDAVRTDEPATPNIVWNHSATPAKQPVEFFRSVVEVLDAWPDTTVTVTRRFRPSDVGYGELQDLRRAFPGRVALGDSMPIDDYLRLLWRSDFQVSTATHESFGISTVEAMYAECCCVLPDRCCYPEVAGGAGIYADSQLAAALHRYLRDPAERERTVRAQRRAIERYFPEVVATRIAAVLAGDEYTPPGVVPSDDQHVLPGASPL